MTPEQEALEAKPGVLRVPVSHEDGVYYAVVRASGPLVKFGSRSFTAVRNAAAAYVESLGYQVEFGAATPEDTQG